MKLLSEMTLREKLGQMFVTGFQSHTLTEEMKVAIEQYKVGNFILFSHNVASKQQLSELISELQQAFTASTGVPGFICIDQEGGRVTRLPNEATNIAGAMAIAATGMPEYSYVAGRITARELMALGINFNLAPVLDINNNRENPVINVRSYGERADDVERYSIPMMKGLIDGGVLSAVKHFPGHGDTDIDSHLGLPIIDKSMEQLEALELRPFQSAIKQGALAVMTAHILFPQIEQEHIPATLSPTIINDILKQKLGFEGLVVSDCLEMDAIRKFYGTEEGALLAIKAGVELIFICHTPKLVQAAIDRIEHAVATGELDIAIIDSAVDKILCFKQQFTTLQPHNLSIVGSAQHERINRHIRSETICQVGGQLVPLEKGRRDQLIVSPAAYRTDLASSGIEDDQLFAKVMSDQLDCEVYELSTDPTKEEINDLLSKCGQYTHIVVAVYNGRENQGQIQLVEQLLTLGVHITVVALGQPYDLSYIDGNYCGLILFEYSAAAFDSLIPILTGEIQPVGKLTISI